MCKTEEVLNVSGIACVFKRTTDFYFGSIVDFVCFQQADYAVTFDSILC